MNLELSEHQVLLAESISGWLRAGGSVSSDEDWSHFAEMGWLAMAVPEELGGLGGGGGEAMILAERLGRALRPTPYLSNMVLAAHVIIALGDARQREALLPDLIEGRVRAALAYAEEVGDDEHPRTRATEVDGRIVVDGVKSLVLDGAQADILIVSASTESGAALFLVRPDSSSVRSHALKLIDGAPVATVEFESAVAEPLGRPEESFEAVSGAIDAALAFVSSEAVGVMDAVLEKTVDYLKARSQFNSPLSEFQVLRHRVVEMKSEIEAARALALGASLSLDAAPDARSIACSAAKIGVGKAGLFVGEQCIQLHGGMGMTEEAGIGDYLKRLMTIELLFGDTDFHERRLADLTLGVAA